MSVSAAAMLAWCQELLDVDGCRPRRSLAEYLELVPRLPALADLPAGTSVLVRGDVDAKVGASVGQGDVRLRSMTATLKLGRQRQWKQVICGHLGRKGDESLAKVAARLGELLDCSVPLVADWLDESSLTIRPDAAAQLRDAAPGSVLMLENTRRYKIERALWKAGPGDLAALARPLAQLANTIADNVARVYVNEALSAGSLDASTTVVPAAMRRVALGAYVGAEFDGPMLRCLASELVVFSGLKTDKLDDLQAMIGRGQVRTVIAGGSLAMALKKAAAELAGEEFCMGLAEQPDQADKPYFIPRERIDQARRMIADGRAKGIDFVLPVDFILQDGQASQSIGPRDQQFDVGPQTSALLERKVGEFIAAHPQGRTAAFYNGVLGMFEDPRFAGGTQRFIGQLKRLHDAGIEVYVGGGEGGAALEQFGHESDVTHSFTAGGTVLNALGSEPVPYLVALSMAAERHAAS